MRQENSRPIPIAVVGAGRFGKKHVERCAEQSRAVLAAIVDPDGEAEAIARRHGARWFRSVADLPAGLVRAAIVAVPSTAHCEVGSALLRSGVDVLIEKPIALRLHDADALIALARAHARILQVGHVERFNPAVLAVPAHGSPVAIHAVRRGPAPRHDGARDVVLDLMIHDIELIIHWIGAMPALVTAHGETLPSSGIDYAEARLLFPRGERAVLVAERGAPLRHVTIESPAGPLHVDLLARRTHGGASARLPVVVRDELGAQTDAFLRAVEQRSIPVVTGEQGRAALDVALQVRRCVVERRSHPAA
jgi:predicted dehydrogenase